MYDNYSGSVRIQNIMVEYTGAAFQYDELGAILMN